MALDFARRGAKVAITYISDSSKAKCEALAAQVEKLDNGSQLLYIRADVSDDNSPSTVVAETVKAYGDGIDVLVNNAAIEIGRSIQDITKEDFDKVYYANVRGPLLLTKAVLPHLRSPGRIINVSSVGARNGFPGLSLYGSSKAALEGLTRCLAAELGHNGTTVNAVAPGPVESDMLDQIPDSIKVS